MIIRRTLAVVAALLLVSGTALAGNHEYRPNPGSGVAAPTMPGGIPPECAAETTRADIVDCIKDKARERGKARVLKGKPPR